MPARILLVSETAASGTIVGALERRGMAVTLARDANVALSRLADHQLIVLDVPDAARLALMCRQINDVAGSRHAPVLAVAHSGDVDERVRLLESGADDVLSHPVDERELEALVEALLLRAPARAQRAAEAPPEAGTARALPSTPGRVIAFAAAKGGAGTTTLAVNTALVLAELAPRSVAIVDMDMNHGQISTHLDLYARSSTAQLAREDQSAHTPEVLHDAGRQHPSGLTVFGGPYRPDEGSDIAAEQLGALTEAFRPAYATVVVDAGSSPDMRALGVLTRADVVVMPITPDIPSLRLLHAALQVMSDVGEVADRAIFVVNNVYARPTIRPEQIEEHLGIKVSLEIPHDGENFLRAVNEGQPLMSLAPRSPAANAIRRLAQLAAASRIEDDVPVRPQRRGRLLGGLLGRR